eukprot:TRINITY_DN2124_c0_g1_i1.p1 TRINITY_DN2124_c0_g1~~TRINITY_DN2124_c0_g1_i1.p1  ORF type:complete len:323 (+),score=49.76 TRINITY_DN2124_c0_g1_i1:91-1059(+)
MSTAERDSILLDPDDLFRTEKLKQDPLEYVKLILGFIFFIPFRIVFGFGFMFMSSWIAGLGLYLRGGLLPSKDPHPYVWWHHYLFECPSRLCGRIMLFFSGFYWISIKGQRAPPSTAPLIVSNHISDIDSLIYYSILPISFVAKAEVGEMLALGPASKSVGCIFVDRLSKNSKTEVRDAIINRANLVKNGKDLYEQLVIFPEETVTNGKGLLTFKTGAFNAGLPVQPLLLRFPHERFNPCLPYGIPSGKWLLQLFSQFVQYCELEYLDVYYPSAEEKSNPVVYGRNVQKLMSKHLGVPDTSFSFEHAKAYSIKQKEAAKKHQ